MLSCRHGQNASWCTLGQRDHTLALPSEVRSVPPAKKWLRPQATCVGIFVFRRHFEKCRPRGPPLQLRKVLPIDESDESVESAERVAARYLSSSALYSGGRGIGTDELALIQTSSMLTPQTFLCSLAFLLAFAVLVPYAHARRSRQD